MKYKLNAKYDYDVNKYDNKYKYNKYISDGNM